MFKLHHLRDLLAIVEKGSINAAARHLGIAQPALSRSIRDLEKDLGVPLLERHTRGAVPTAMGAIFVRRATAAVTELRRARDEIEQLQGEVHGTVAACLSSLAHVVLLPHALQAFMLRYPNVRLHLIEGVYPVIESQLKSGAIDFYVGPGPESGPAPELHQERLFDNDTRIVFARKEHPLAQARHLAELREVRWITTHITSADESEFSDALAQAGVPAARLALRADSALGWITAVASTDMMTIAPRQWLQHPLVRSLLQQVPVEETLQAPGVVLIRRSAVPPTPAADHFCDLVRRAAAHVDADRGAQP